ncbi:hypothetical protein GFM01_34600 [Rhizobium laguerreae]|uniref:hypothetical protein n=1 Tax=Rhizobium laguerreae TaxID=1076926 RepID=UPI001441EFE8|nr:hypothetical protein [Rhizobium laguerreae]NKM22772.1 hypothetical protein [Rhizobium laguerreae]
MGDPAEGTRNAFRPESFARREYLHAIWEMLVRKDGGGFVAQDWKIFAPSFKFEGFWGTTSCRGRRYPKTAMAPEL